MRADASPVIIIPRGGSLFREKRNTSADFPGGSCQNLRLSVAETGDCRLPIENLQRLAQPPAP